jgi:hypothetical protein
MFLPEVLHLNVDVPRDCEERRGYHYFRFKTVGEILGQQDADFLGSLFLQVDHLQPAVKHALIAVASIHESLELSENDTLGYNDAVARKRWAFSLIHYNKAIQLLIKDDQQPYDRLDTAIVMCILSEGFTGWCPCLVLESVEIYGGSRRN